MRDRIDALLDPKIPFLELSTLAASKAYNGEVPGAAQVVGIGIVAGREAMVHADDASVKGGAWYPLSVEKIVRALDVAIENRLSVIHLCGGAGGFLPFQAEFFADRYFAGRIHRNQSILSKMEVPRVAIALGHYTAGAAYVPALSEFNIMDEDTGAIFLGGPPVVKAATGEDVSVQELGGAYMHTSVSGTSDYSASSEMHAIAIARDIVARFHRPAKTPIDQAAPEPPAYDASELYGIIPKDPRVQFDMREIIARMIDGSRFHEYQLRFGTSLLCGFARLHGYQIGILANNGVPLSESALKGAHFIQRMRQEPEAPALPAEYDGFHGRPRVRAPWHNEGWCQADHGRLGGVGPELYGRLQQLARSRYLRYGGTCFRSSVRLHLAAVSDLCDGRRASGRCAEPR